MDHPIPILGSNYDVREGEKKILADIVKEVSPLVGRAAEVVSVPMGGPCVKARSMVVCTAERLDPEARMEIMRRVAGSLKDHKFDLFFRTGEMTREYADAIAASRQWIRAAWSEDLKPLAATKAKAATTPRRQLPQPASRIKAPWVVPTATAGTSTTLPRPGGRGSAGKASAAVSGKSTTPVTRKPATSVSRKPATPVAQRPITPVARSSTTAVPRRPTTPLAGRLTTPLAKNAMPQTPSRLRVPTAVKV